MCNVVVINRGDVEIGTPRQFEDHFGFKPKKHESYLDLEPDLCLCQCDLDQTFEENNIEFKRSFGDYYVGELDMVVEE